MKKIQSQEQLINTLDQTISQQAKTIDRLNRKLYIAREMIALALDAENTFGDE